MHALRKLETLKQEDRATLYDLFKQLVGAEGGIAATAFVTAVGEFVEDLADLVCDAPKIPECVSPPSSR